MIGRVAPRIARLRIAERLISLEDGASLPTSYRNPALRLGRSGRLEIRSEQDGRRLVTVLYDDELAHHLKPGMRVFPAPDGVSGSISLSSVVAGLVGPSARRTRQARSQAARRLCAAAVELGATEQGSIR